MRYFVIKVVIGFSLLHRSTVLTNVVCVKFSAVYRIPFVMQIV